MAPSNISKEKEVSSAKEKILKIKREILKVVEDMLEKDISKEWFLKNCVKLCKGDYGDVIQERSIEYMCGYPLCSKPIKEVVKQKYHISSVSNKVYELSERKCFCSNECYKASNFVKHQLSSLPLYMRKEAPVKISLIVDGDNKGSAGEEVVFEHVLTQKEVESQYVPQVPINCNLSKMLENEVKNCANSLKDLTIKENVYENPYVFEKEPNSKTDHSPVDSDEEPENIYYDDSSDEDQNLFPEYENIHFLSQKQMPVPSQVKKAVLITPLKPIEKTTEPLKLSPVFIHKIFQDWMTEDTMKYLLGERQLYASKADLLFQRMMTSESASGEKLAAMKSEYIDMCLKLNKLPEDCYEAEFEVTNLAPPDEKTVSGSDEKSNSVDCAGVQEIPSISAEQNKKSSTKLSVEKSNSKKKPKKKPKSKRKEVTFAPGIKDLEIKTSEDVDANSENCKKTPVPEPVFPLIDSLSQNALRKQVMIGKLKSVYFDILPQIGLHYADIRDALKDIVDTFSLTPINIVLKPKEWKTVAVVLYRILTKTVLKNLHEENKFEKILEDPVVSATMNLKELEDIVTEITSPQQFLKLQAC